MNLPNELSGATIQQWTPTDFEWERDGLSRRATRRRDGVIAVYLENAAAHLPPEFFAWALGQTEPPPAPIGVGDPVGTIRDGGEEGVVLAIDGEQAWVKWEAGYRSTYPLAVLRRTGGPG